MRLIALLTDAFGGRGGIAQFNRDLLRALCAHPAREIPDVAYLVCGDGNDRARLEAKARRLELAERVVFAAYVPEEEKIAPYRLADAFVRPGHAEGVGIVYLEALAQERGAVPGGLDYFSKERFTRRWHEIVSAFARST